MGNKYFASLDIRILPSKIYPNAVRVKIKVRFFKRPKHRISVKTSLFLCVLCPYIRHTVIYNNSNPPMCNVLPRYQMTLVGSNFPIVGEIFTEMYLVP